MSEEKIEKGEQTPTMDEKIYNQHNWCIVSLIMCCFWAFIALIGFNGLLFTPFYPTGIFTNATSPLDITPATWTFAIWAVIYMFQFGWLVYTLFCLFRLTPQGSYLYLKPDFMCYGMYICAIVCYMANIALCFHLGSVYWAFFFNMVMAFSMRILLFISCRKIVEHQSEMTQCGFGWDLWFVRVVVHNGCAMYGTWTTLCTIHSFGMFLVVGGAMVMPMSASTLCLCMIMVATITYFIFENFVWRDYLRYMYIPYFVVCWWFVGSISANLGTPLTRNNIITMCFICVCICLIVARVLLNFFYKTKYPEGFNFNKLIKVNKIFKSSRNGSQQNEQDQQSTEQLP